MERSLNLHRFVFTQPALKPFSDWVHNNRSREYLKEMYSYHKKTLQMMFYKGNISGMGWGVGVWVGVGGVGVGVVCGCGVCMGGGVVRLRSLISGFFICDSNLPVRIFEYFWYCTTGTGAMVRWVQRQGSNPEGYGSNIPLSNNTEVWVVCILLEWTVIKVGSFKAWTLKSRFQKNGLLYPGFWHG